MDRNHLSLDPTKIDPGSRDATILLNGSGIISYINQHGCNNFGYKAKELIGKTLSYILPDLVINENREGKIIHQYGRHRDGHTFSLFIKISSFKLHNELFFLMNLYTVKDRSRLNEQQSYQLNELVDLKFALDASSIVAITDQRGIINYVNDQFCKISKYSRDELLGKDHKIINSGHHSKEFFKELWTTISSGHVWKGELKNKAKDGTYYWVDTTIVPFLNEDGIPYQHLAIRHEVTQRKNAEEELKKMMTKIIDIQEDERKRLSRELHDGIGQNLYSHLITINRLKEEINHTLLDQLQDEATEIIEELRDISWELRPSVLDDLGLIPAIRSYLVRYTEYYQISVHFDCFLNYRLNSNKEITIYRIIQEALTNIRKYAHTEDATVTIREMDEEIRVVIEDKGKGFNIDNISRGVGLFSMKERAKAAGGSIRIHSTEGKGTTVVLEIPLGV
ncbi:PAS domain S-box protein [Bacillus sp. SM2101]|uniref:sensor histidine kinase n=1 Tax=Bacillus sp. SM2101 TaxID=2805366 RepID=UPI001BDEF3EC|nr:PAS domain S-box protein [Bacillus sp. SM2101]